MRPKTHDIVHPVEPLLRPVRDEQHRAAARCVEDVVHQTLRRPGVEMCGRLVEHQNRCVREQRAGDDDALALPAGQLAALFADERVPPLRKATHPVQDSRPPECVLDLVIGRVLAPEADVLADGRGEEVRVLARDGDRPANVFLSTLAYSRPPRVDAAGLRVEEDGRAGSRPWSPAPLGPTRATRPPGSSRRSTPSSAELVPPARSGRGRLRARPRTAPPGAARGGRGRRSRARGRSARGALCPAAERLGQLSRGQGKAAALPRRGEREQCEHRDQDPVEAARGMRRDRGGEHAGRRSRPRRAASAARRRRRRAPPGGSGGRACSRPRQAAGAARPRGRRRRAPARLGPSPRARPVSSPRAAAASPRARRSSAAATAGTAMPATRRPTASTTAAAAGGTRR